ncbi:palmitoyltransferase for Vac8p [Marasmius tenuissimus]|uniref:Palmitoyltransferase n=1 Tax=Marasmius tenuissimus TaxID=585030 RepID=A0ABR3A5Z6_9AGAR
MNPLSPDDERPVRKWYHNAYLFVTVILILSPHPSLLYFLVNHYLKTLNAPIQFTTHLLVTYSLTFLALSSLIICVARDPGPVSVDESEDDSNGGEVGLSEALLDMDEDFNSPAKWCRKCWGHRTYPAFLHLLTCVTFLAIYISGVCASFIRYAFSNPFDVDESIPFHAIGLFFAGCIFGLVIGSFLVYHLYLVTTNQTTVEHISPFLLLRYLPRLPQTGHKLSDPPLEHELSFPQRRLIKDAHASIRLYDVGWKKNWAQVLGWNRRFGWMTRLLCGGAGMGDGKVFPKNIRSEELLERLAKELVEVDKDH